MTGTPEYRAWVGMIGRCTVVSNKRYAYYGGRGVKVHPQWRESFGNFYEDMGARPGPNYSIDRIDVNGDYTPTNCRWATAKQQANNRRTNVRYTAHGRTATIAQWADYLGVGVGTIRKRISAGVHIDKVFSRQNARYGSTLKAVKAPRLPDA